MPQLHEAIFKGFDGKLVIGPARVYLKPYWKERGVSYLEGGTVMRRLSALGERFSVSPKPRRR